MRLSHERVGQSITLIRVHGPEQCRFCALYLAEERMVRGGANLRAYRGVALHYAFFGGCFSLERLKASQRDANAPQFMT